MLAQQWSLIQGNIIKVLSMNYCCTVGLPTLLLYYKLLVQDFEKEIYFEMCILHRKPFFVKPRGFFAFNCQNPEKKFCGSRKSSLYSTSMHSYGSQTTLTYSFIDFFLIIDALPYLWL